MLFMPLRLFLCRRRKQFWWRHKLFPVTWGGTKHNFRTSFVLKNCFLELQRSGAFPLTFAGTTVTVLEWSFLLRLFDKRFVSPELFRKIVLPDIFLWLAHPGFSFSWAENPIHRLVLVSLWHAVLFMMTSSGKPGSSEMTRHSTTTCGSHFRRFPFLSLTAMLPSWFKWETHRLA